MKPRNHLFNLHKFDRHLLVGAHGAQQRADHKACNSTPIAMALRQRPVDELHLSQKRNKALERLGLGLRDEAPTQQQGFSVLHPWFVEATKETEYREAAFSLHRRVLVCLLIQISLVYLAATILWVLFVSLGLVPVVRVSNIGQPIQASLLVLRVFFSAAAALIAYLVHRERVSAQLTARMLLPLTYLVAAIPMLNLARDAHEAHAEAVEVAMVYLVVYRLFVPIFPVRYVALAMWGLTGAQFAYMLYIYWHALGVHARLVCRELVKGVVLNMAGCAMGFAVERVRRRNFLGAALYKDEVQLMSSVRRDVQRLLLNTLPEPIVKEVAAGQVEIAHRYEQVTVVQADMVGFTPLSASRSAAEILQILSELFGTFDELSEAIGVHKVPSRNGTTTSLNEPSMRAVNEPQMNLKCLAMIVQG